MIHNFQLIENQFQLIKTDRGLFLKFLKQFQLIEKQIGSIKADRGFLKTFKTISIDRKTDWINRIRQRLTKFLRKNTVFENNKDTF